MSESIKAAAVALQDLQVRYPELDLPIPRFVLAGEQSSGKTRMLSFFAAMKIGGAEKSQCGTRCPVVYQFRTTNSEPEAATGKANAKAKTCEFEQVEKNISAHMNSLKDSFSKQPFHVEISGRHCLNAVVIDLPGIKPGNSAEVHEVNETIGEMIFEATTPRNSIVLLMTEFASKLDVEYFEQSLDRTLGYCNDRTGAANRGCLFVSRLDAVFKEITLDKLQQHVRIAERKGFQRKNMHFFTLKPELLDPNETSEMFEGGKGSFDDLAVYFKETAFQKETEFLTGSGNKKQTVLANRKLTDPDLNFGVLGAKLFIEKRLEDATCANLRAARDLLEQEWRNFEEEALLLMGEDDRETVKRRIGVYLKLVTSCLEGAATSNPYVVKRCFTDVLRECLNNGDAALFSIRDPDFPEKLIDKVKTTFEQEHQSVKKSMGSESFAQLLRSDAFGQFEERESLSCPMSPGAAVSRLLRLFGYLLLKRDFEDVTPQEIENIGENTNRNEVDTFPVDKIIGQIAQNKSHSDLMFGFVIRWCAWLYYRQTVTVCGEVRQWYLLDQTYPTLVDYLVQLVDEEYRKVFTKAAQQISDEVISVIKHRLGELKLHETVSVLNLLCCSKLCSDMMQHDASKPKIEDATKPKAPGSPKVIPKVAEPQAGALSYLDKLRDRTETVDILSSALTVLKDVSKQNVLQPEVTAAINLLVKLVENPDCSPGRDFFRFLGEANFDQVMAFVRMEGFNLRNIHRSEIKGHADSINKTTQMIVNFNDGLIFMELYAMVTNGLVKVAKRTFDTIRSQLEQAIHELLAEEGSLEELLSDNKTAVLRADACRKFEQLLSTIEKLNGCCRETQICPTIPTQAKRRLYSELKKLVSENSVENGNFKNVFPGEESNNRG